MDYTAPRITPKLVADALGISKPTLHRLVAAGGPVGNLDAQRRGWVQGGTPLYSYGDFWALAICVQAQRFGALDRTLGHVARMAIDDSLKGKRVLYITLDESADSSTGQVTRFHYDSPPKSFVTYLAIDMIAIIASAEEGLQRAAQSPDLRTQEGDA